MATTYTRIKNRRGLKIDPLLPLADGEIGLATDTREVYIGAGTQDLLNADVQVTLLNAQVEVTDDLSNGTLATNNGILNFNIAGTEVPNWTQMLHLLLPHNTLRITPHRSPKRTGGSTESRSCCYKIYKRNSYNI